MERMIVHIQSLSLACMPSCQPNYICTARIYTLSPHQIDGDRGVVRYVINYCFNAQKESEGCKPLRNAMRFI
jgi:hypothetical protein